jgi:hypothetical protein
VTTPTGQYPSHLSVQDIHSIYQGQQIGPFSYAAGVSGSRTVSGRIQTILAHSTAGGSMTINGGDSIPIPANVGFAISPCGNVADAALVFTGTDMYYVELTT